MVADATHDINQHRMVLASQQTNLNMVDDWRGQTVGGRGAGGIK